MTKEEIRKEVKDYLRQQYHLNGGGIVFGNLEELLLSFAELKEKRIEELLALVQAERKRQEQCDDIHLRKIADLEQENAELKKEVEDSNEKVVHLACNQNKDLKYKLTKARELLNEFLDFEASCMERGIYISDKTRAETEQFISEVEND